MRSTIHPSAPAKHRVLVVDDYPDSAQLVCALVQNAGHVSRAANSGRAALAEAYAFDPSIVILDLDLPDLSGYEVARALRHRPGGRRFYIAALSGWGQHQKRNAALAAGSDQYVIKPGNAEVIRRIMTFVQRLEPVSPGEPSR